MSFRTRLTSFFVLIVVIPMIAVGVVVFRLIGDSQQGKAQARASGLAAVAAALYSSQATSARSAARVIAGQVQGTPDQQLPARARAIAAAAGLARIRIRVGSHLLADVGARNAIAPGSARLAGPGGAGLRVSAATLTAGEYVRQLSSPTVRVVVRSGGRLLASSVPVSPQQPLPRQGSITLAGRHYQALTETQPGFGRGRVAVTLLSDESSTGSSVAASRLLAGALIAGFLLLALGFALLATRALQAQLRRFLDAARRLGQGDFSAPVPVEGEDEFAALGQEFNAMSAQLEERIRDLAEQQDRLRASTSRIGETFAANLDREGLLHLALRTATDALEADFGRVTARSAPDEPLSEYVAMGDHAAAAASVLRAEQQALQGAGIGEAEGEYDVLSLRLGMLLSQGRARGLITVARARAFSQDDRQLLRSLASQAALAVENVELHYQVRRQAVTDELTGLANHRRFHDLLVTEIEQVRRYHHPLALIMVDLDDFKSINDGYGHQQGDLVLSEVARVLRENSREADTPARYGGEEMAVILPHTDLDGAYAIAERIRTAIGGLTVPRLDGGGGLHVTASLGVATSSGAGKDELLSDADAALYQAKREGKNRTVKAPVGAASAPSAGKV